MHVLDIQSESGKRSYEKNKAEKEGREERATLGDFWTETWTESMDSRQM